MFLTKNKEVAIIPAEISGDTSSEYLSSKTDLLTVELKGTINGIQVNEQVEIEDVESTGILAFPPTGSAPNQDISALKNVISSLQKDVIELKSKVGSGNVGYLGLSKSYDFAVFGLALGAAGVALAVIAMIKRK